MRWVEHKKPIERLLARVTRADSTPEALAAALAHLPASVELVAAEGPAEEVWLHERQVDVGRLVFLANTSRDQAVALDVRLRSARAVTAWDLETGQAAGVDQRTDGEDVVATVTLAPGASALWELGDRGPADAEPVVRAGVELESIPLAGPWRITFLATRRFSVHILPTCMARAA